MAHDETFTLAADPDAAHLAAQALFTTVQKELATLLPPSAEVLHIGATAIPGCLTKGDLDIVVRVAPHAESERPRNHKPARQLKIAPQSALT